MFSASNSTDCQHLTMVKGTVFYFIWTRLYFKYWKICMPKQYLQNHIRIEDFRCNIKVTVLILLSHEVNFSACISFILLFNQHVLSFLYISSIELNPLPVCLSGSFIVFYLLFFCVVKHVYLFLTYLRIAHDFWYAFLSICLFSFPSLHLSAILLSTHPFNSRMCSIFVFIQ